MLENLFLQVINMSFTGSFVVVFVLFARFLLKKAPKIFSYGLWSVVLFRLLCPFSFESVFSLIPVNTTPIPQNIVYMQTPQVNTGLNIINNSINTILPPATPYASINPLQIWVFFASMVWILGIFALITYSVFTLFNLKRRLKDSIFYKDNIFFSKNINTAFVMGIFRPRIYLPDNLNDSSKHYILLHEQNHIKRFDHIIKLVSFLALCIHWFNPFVWAAFFFSSKDMELSCDESVIKTLGNHVKKEYSTSLLTLSTDRHIVGATPLAFGEGDTKNRVKNVLSYKKPKLLVIFLGLAVVIFLVFGLMTNPKNDDLDLSLLNPAMFANVVFQQEVNDIPAHFEDGEIHTVNAKVLAQLLKETKWVQKHSASLELIPSYTIKLNGITVNSYKSHPDLIMIFDDINYRYYTSDNIYEKLLKISFPPQRDGTKAPPAKDANDLELAIHQAILSQEENNHKRADFIAESHIILGSEATRPANNSSKIDTVTVYAMVLIQSYNFTEDGFSNEGGSHNPVAITFDVTDDNYVLNNYWQPRDGSYYSADIEKRFPKGIVKDSLDTQRYVIAQMQNCYAQVISYNNIDPYKMIASIIDDMAQMEGDISSNWRLSSKHNELTFFGDYMLIYANNIFSQGNQNDEKAKIIQDACSVILKQYGEYVNFEEGKTPQEWFDSYVANLEHYKAKEGIDYIKQNMPKGSLLLTVN